jgi:hypothetical protein
VLDGHPGSGLHDRQGLAARQLQIGAHPPDDALHAGHVLVDLSAVVTAKDDVEPRRAGAATVVRHSRCPP